METCAAPRGGAGHSPVQYPGARPPLCCGFGSTPWAARLSGRRGMENTPRALPVFGAVRRTKLIIWTSMDSPGASRGVGAWISFRLLPEASFGSFSVNDAKKYSLRFHDGSCCFAGKAIFYFNFLFGFSLLLHTPASRPLFSP